MRTMIGYNTDAKTLVLYNADGLICVMNNVEWPVVAQLRQGMADADRFTRENPNASVSQLLKQLNHV